MSITERDRRLPELRGELKGEMSELRAEMVELRAEMSAFRAEITGQFQAFKGEMNGEFKRWGAMIVAANTVAVITALLA